MTFRFLHTADLHLDSPLKGLEKYDGAPVEALRGATREALENLVELAVQENVSFVLISGDIYDGDWKDYNTGLFFSAQMNRLSKAGIPVYLIRGNHDAASLITKELALPENVHEFPAGKAGTEKIEPLKTAIHGRGFLNRAETENLVHSYPEAVEGYLNIGLLHTSLTGREGHENYAPCSLEDLSRKGYDYWALGHIHLREVVREHGPAVVFPGNIQGRHIRESGSKGCTLVTVEDGAVESLEHRPLDVIRWFDVQADISELASEDHLLERIGTRITELYNENGGRFLAVRIHITGTGDLHETISVNRDHFVNNVRAKSMEAGGDVWIEKVKFHTSASVDRGRFRADTPLGYVFEYLDSLEADPVETGEILEEIKDLYHALPSALKDKNGAFDPDSPSSFTSRKERIEDILLHKLSGKGEG
ncbi:metallophosphoesterase family protein [Alteribacter natronophilus]|uniref:metallophosphoesterase family protein n=1 Tax=Alteribacter natronophilus TaxID=2583810 RepID=UPI00110DACC1|nr:DNA repair exonuclease [Alteribacter natronophilus]TMW73399.1 DNA repair exonuclease [Alteribacter natronophilus]